VNATRAQFEARTHTLTLNGKTGTRDITLSAAAMVLFKKLAEGKEPTDLLLTRDDGKQWAHSDWDELVRDAATAAKLSSGTCLYTLRHSWITTALSSGMSTLEVARLCGTSLLMIEKNYGHLVSKETRKRLDKVAML
jgi:site-specific recombinase XerD